MIFFRFEMVFFIEIFYLLEIGPVPKRYFGFECSPHYINHLIVSFIFKLMKAKKIRQINPTTICMKNISLISYVLPRITKLATHTF